MAPTKKPKNGEPPFATKSCDVCADLDSVEMVQCDVCNHFTHFSCAGVDASIETKPWCCRACDNKRKTRSSSVVMSESSPNLATPPMLSTPTTSTVKPALTEDPKKMQDKLLAAQREITKLKREFAQSLERERENTNREHEAAREAMNIAEALRTELKMSRDQHDQIVQEHRMRAGHAAREVEETRLLFANSNAELESLRAAVAEKTTQSIEIQTSVVESAELPEKSFEERLQDLRASLSSSENSERVVNQVVNETAPRANVQFAADAVAETIVSKLATMVPQLVRNLAPGLSTRPIPLRDSALHLDNAKEVTQAQSVQQTPVDRLAVTMSRNLLTTLPEFDGHNIKEWPYFESVYESTTVQGQYSDVENINRLRNCLKSKAAETVKSHLMYPISAAEIMSELREAYGKPDQILKELTSDLLETSHIKSPIDPTLRNFSTSLRNYVASLIKIGRAKALENSYVLVRLEDKLHHSHRKDWIVQKEKEGSSGREASICSFAEFVKDRVKELPPLNSSHPSSEFSSRGVKKV